MTTLSSCMDRYINRHMIPPPVSHHQTSNQSNYFHQKNIAGGACRGGNGGGGGGGSHQQQQQQQQSHHHQNYVPNCYQNTNGWTGVPLISTASRRPKKFNNNRHLIKSTNQLTDFDENAMSRLAIHAHGAPLILAGRYRNKSSQHKREQSKIASGTFNKGDSDRNCYSLLHHKQQIIHNSNNNNNNNSNTNNNVNNSNATNTIIANGTLDTFSVNSDESSNSSINVDTCLPRIIKPRKRRKKDRKPNINTQQSELVQSINNNSNAMINNNNNNSNSTNFNCINNHFEQPPPITQDHKMTTQMGHTGHTMHASNNSLPNEIMQRYEQELNDLPDGMTDMQNKTDGMMEEASSCSCRLCDPLCRIWAFPLRRSCSDKSETEIRQNKNVGVIGSNRIMTVRNEWRSSPQLLVSPMLCDRFEFIGSRKGSFSDSGDSGCDILSGLSFSDDILRSNSRNDNHSTITSPLTDNLEFNFPTTVTTDNNSIFGESINEISRKLMESMDLSGRSSASEDSGSVFSDSVFSDDFFMNFESLQQQSSELFSAGQTGQMFFNPNQTNHSINDNSECIMSSSSSSAAKQMNMSNDSLVFIDKDRGDEVINCFDMVWSNRRLQPVEE